MYELTLHEYGCFKQKTNKCSAWKGFIENAKRKRKIKQSKTYKLLPNKTLPQPTKFLIPSYQASTIPSFDPTSWSSVSFSCKIKPLPLKKI